MEDYLPQNSLLIQNTGTEQHRHHAVEIALYNMFSILMEMETTKEYKMTKANDIYSGLGKEAQFLPERDEKADAVQKEEEVIIELDDEEGKPTEPADDSKEIEDAKVDQSPYAEYVKWQNNLVDDLLRAENISNILDGVKVESVAILLFYSLTTFCFAGFPISWFAISYFG